MAVNGEAIYGTTASPFARAPFRATTRGNRLNLFVTDWPAGADPALTLPGLQTPVRGAWLMADRDRRPLTVTASAAGPMVALPSAAPDPICSVIVVDLEGAPSVR